MMDLVYKLVIYLIVLLYCIKDSKISYLNPKNLQCSSDFVIIITKYQIAINLQIIASISLLYFFMLYNLII